MISSRVELFYLPTEATSSRDLQRIGHFEFQNNLQHDHGLQPVRELKTVHFNVTTKQLTINLYDPFQRKENIFH